MRLRVAAAPGFNDFSEGQTLGYRAVITRLILAERRTLGVELEPVTLKFVGNKGNVGNRRPRAAVFMSLAAQ